MNKSVYVHLKNKYPNAIVTASEDSVDVHDTSGHVVAVRKDGAGSWRDMSEELGCTGRFCLAPIPKDARVHKLHKDGKIGLDDQAEARKTAREKFQCDVTGKIKSMDELSKEGFKFDKEGNLLSAPAQANA